MSDILNLLIPAGIVLVVLVGSALVFSSFYKRASKEISFVRTGFGGEKVIMDGGSLVLPIIHELITVNMNTLRLVVARREDSSLITKDRMRVDVTAEFYVRVGKTAESISAAATTLGSKTIRPDELKALIEGKFVDALRSVAASMQMSELHEQRKDFVLAVQEAVQTDLEKNGLELEAVSLTGLDQTSRKYFDENNAFDAEGLTKLTQEIETRRKTRNEIEQQTSVDIERERNEARKQKLAIERDGEVADIEQKRDIEESRARSESQVSVTRSEQDRIKEEAEIKRSRDTEMAQQDKSIAIANKSEAEAAARTEAQKALATAVRAEESVNTSRQLEIADRNKSISIIKAEEEAEKTAVNIRVQADAEKAAAYDKAEAIKISSTAEAEKLERLAKANKETLLAKAAGVEAMNAAENTLSQNAMRLRERITLIQELPKIVELSVKPLENIESIKIIDTGRISASISGDGSTDGSHGVEGIVNGALKYRAQAPFVDHLISELGIDGGLNGLINKGPAAFSSSPAETPSASEKTDSAPVDTTSSTDSSPAETPSASEKTDSVPVDTTSSTDPWLLFK